MPKYLYTAIDLKNKKISGEIDARDDDDLRRLLRAQNLVPSKYGIVEEKATGYRMKSNDVSEFPDSLPVCLQAV